MRLLGNKVKRKTLKKHELFNLVLEILYYNLNDLKNLKVEFKKFQDQHILYLSSGLLKGMRAKSYEQLSKN